MFKCQKCEKTTQPGETQHRVVVEKRQKEYTDEFKRPIGFGWEVGREANVCGECAKQYAEKEAS